MSREMFSDRECLLITLSIAEEIPFNRDGVHPQVIADALTAFVMEDDPRLDPLQSNIRRRSFGDAKISYLLRLMTRKQPHLVLAGIAPHASRLQKRVVLFRLTDIGKEKAKELQSLVPTEARERLHEAFVDIFVYKHRQAKQEKKPRMGKFEEARIRYLLKRAQGKPPTPPKGA